MQAGFFGDVAVIRSLVRTAALLALVVGTGLIAEGAADDPEFAGRRGSEWVRLLKEDSSPRKRKAAVVALGQLWADGR